MMVELTALAGQLMGTRSIYRELGQHHAPLVRPLGEASRRAEPEAEPASGRASKLWLPTARVVDIGYCGYSEPFGGAAPRAIQASVRASQVPIVL